MSAAVNSITDAQSDLIGRGAGGLESGEESGASESRALQRTWMVFGSITIEIVAPEAVSSHSSLIGEVGPELRGGADAGAASRVLFGGRARSYLPRQCGALGCGSNPSKIKSPRMSAV